MGYLHINNLYKDQTIFYFKEVWCMEKIHGTSAHISFDGNIIKFFSGGSKHENFVNLFNYESLITKFNEIYTGTPITIYGEAYGGKLQGMSDTYGNELKFIVFDIQIGDCWLNVESANRLALSFGLEFVHHVKVETTLENLNKEMERDSVQGIRNGMGEGHPSEGIVIRPLIEVTLNNGNRVIVKHKKDKFRETNKERQLKQPLEVLVKAKEIANEWVTFMRLQHVADAIEKEICVENISYFIPAMVKDIQRESQGEVSWSKDAEKEIGRQTALLIKTFVKDKLNNSQS